MVARENYQNNNTTTTDESGGNKNNQSNNNNNNANATNATLSSTDNHKLILKLPKTLTTASTVATTTTTTTQAENLLESQQVVVMQEPHEQATCSSSSSSSSSNSSISSIQAEDTRKVEPLKINLLQQMVPKITIKPIFKQQASNCDTAASSDCSSSAEDELLLRTTSSTTTTTTLATTRNKTQSDSSVDSSSPNSPNEPHIVPKLTIRSANEEGGTAHTTIVPKLTIKMHESGNTSNSLTEMQQTLPPPLPKLTIKTTQDGSSGSIISSLSPASTSSCSSNSSCNASATVSSSGGGGGGGVNLVPKLTIKTNAVGGACVSSTETEQQQQQLQPQQQQDAKIPKLMIKTAQEHAMIITQHSNDVSSTQTIPKLTIKTKTYKGENEMDEETIVHEKIPKLTIKTSDDALIPKLTISGANLGTPQSPRQHNQHQHQQNERVPKLMISRQQDNLMTINNHCETKINFKTNTISDESKEKGVKLLKKNNCLLEEQEKVPKLTIKNLNNKQQQQQQLTITEDCHDMKIVPKLTIKNLCSPKLKMKAVLEDENTNGTSYNNNNDKTQHSATNATTTTTKNTCNEQQLDSDDMDIDVALQEAHDPLIFNNVSPGLIEPCNNLNISKSSLLTTAVRRVIDTVDLTSSPERSPKSATATMTPLLLERLQRDTSVIQTAVGGQQQTEHTSFLLNQLNAPLAMPNLKRTSMITQLLQHQQQQQPTNKNAKYPHLTERLLANGVHAAASNSPTTAGNVKSSNETVIDSIEILDTSDGSRSSLDENASMESVDAAVQPLNNGLYLHEQPALMHFNNDINLMKSKKCLDEHYLNTAPNKIRRLDLEHVNNRDVFEKPASDDTNTITPNSNNTFHCNSVNLEKPFVLDTNTSPITPTHRSRKQKHDRLLNIDEEDPLEIHTMHEKTSPKMNSNKIDVTMGSAPPTAKKRGRPKKIIVATSTPMETDKTPVLPPAIDQRSKSRRVQLLRKRLAIDMVAAEQPFGDEVEQVTNEQLITKDLGDATRRGGRPSKNNTSSGAIASKRGRRAAAVAVIKMATSPETAITENRNNMHHYGGSNSSLSSGCSSGSLNSTTITTTTVATANVNLQHQIDLTMCSSSSSVHSYGQNTLTATNADAGQNSMLPPAKILSSSDRVPDVIFKPNDFSSILVTQQLRANNSNSNHNEDKDGMSSDNSLDSRDSSPLKSTPTRGRGRGRGSRGARGAGGSAGRGGSVTAGRGSGRGSRGHRLGRGASAVAKAIAMSRPRCIGGLKHTPDPKRLKGLISPSPQNFEEDTCMSADLSQIHNQLQQDSMLQSDNTNQSAVRQLDFLQNDESQSSVISSASILDPNTLLAMQNGGSALKQRPKKKKMEVCVSEEHEFSVSSIAEYDWPRPKGCCPSKNRDTFMIQEQVALYLGIKSFKRKYPDLPRRQIDMEERNWLQEKGLVSEKMCDLGITAVWASDILDIMYADFYEKYEEYKDYVRQKHLREIEAKQKALGISILGNARGLQVRERAMLSASKWNSYFTRVRKSERTACLDLQSLTVNVPAPASAPVSTILNRQMADTIADIAAVENISEPPTLMPKRVIDMSPKVHKSYPLALITGQFSEHYRHFTAQQLRVLPLHTALADVRTLCDADNEEEDTPQLLYGSRQKRHKRRQRRVKTHVKSVESESDDADAENCQRLSNRTSKRHAVSPIVSTSSSSSTSCSSTTSCSDSESTTSSEDEAMHKCGVCNRIQNSNPKQMPEVFIKCYTCSRNVHPSCIEMPNRMVGRVRNYNWQCADCKCCIKCKRRQDKNQMLFCEQCDRCYHIYCLELKTVPDGRWSCARCSICMRCGATKPEGWPQQPQLTPNGSEKVKQIKHKKVKWINEYRIDHITKLREHCNMLCVPCARTKPINKRVHIVTPTSNTANISKSKLSNNVGNNQHNNINSQHNNSTVVKTNATLTTDASGIKYQRVVSKNMNNSINGTIIHTKQTPPITGTLTTILNKKPTTSSSTNQQQSQHQIVRRLKNSTQSTCQKLPTTNKPTAIRTITTPTSSTTTPPLSTPATTPITSTATTINSNSNNSGNGDISLAGATTLPPPPVVA